MIGAPVATATFDFVPTGLDGNSSWTPTAVAWAIGMSARVGADDDDMDSFSRIVMLCCFLFVLFSFAYCLVVFS